MDMRKCPGDVGELDAAGDPRVLIDVVRIVVVNEIVPECLIKTSHVRMKRPTQIQAVTQRMFRLWRAVDWLVLCTCGLKFVKREAA